MNEGNFHPVIPENKFNRRAVLTLAGIGVFSGILAVLGIKNSTKRKVDTVTKPELHRAPKGKFDMGTLTGSNMADLYGAYTGIDGVARPVEDIDFLKCLDALWEKKREKAPGSIVKNTGVALLKEYDEKDPQRTTITDYIRKISDIAREMRKKLDWQKIASIKALNQAELALLYKIVNSLDGKSMVAYSMTELMPGSNGQFNIKVLDFLLRNAGERYVASIPALFDTKTSFGHYQFTEFAIFDIADVRRGASTINQAITDVNFRVPGSVSLLRGDAHHRAAFLNMINNLAFMLNDLKPEFLKRLEDIWQKKPSEIVQAIACAHNAPRYAKEALHHWLRAGANTAFERSCNHQIRVYAQKTGANFASLAMMK